MPVYFLKTLQNALIVTTLFPILWFSVSSLSVLGGVRLTGLEQPLLVTFVYSVFWATPLLMLVGLVLGSWQRARAYPLPRLYFPVLFTCAAIWLGLLGLFSLFPN